MAKHGPGNEDRAYIRLLHQYDSPATAVARLRQSTNAPLQHRSSSISSGVASSGPWKGEGSLIPFMKKPPLMKPSPLSAMSLGSNNLHNSTPRSSKRPFPIDPMGSNNARGAIDVDARSEKRPRLATSHPMSWRSKPNSQETEIERCIDGRPTKAPESSRSDPITVEDESGEDTGKPLDRPFGNADLGGSKRPAYTASTRNLNAAGPSKKSRRGSSVVSASSDELNMRSTKKTRSEVPVYGHRERMHDSVSRPNASNARYRDVSRDFAHDSVSQAFASRVVTTAGGDVAANERPPSPPTSPPIDSRKSPSWEGIDADRKDAEASEIDTIESFPSDEDFTERTTKGARLPKTPRTTVSPSLGTIKTGNTKAKAASYSTRPRKDGPWNGNSRTKDFEASARTQQSHVKGSQLKVREKMQPKVVDMTGPSDHEPLDEIVQPRNVHATYHLDAGRSENTAGTGEHFQAGRGRVLPGSSSKPAPFAPPADDVAMQKSTIKSNGRRTRGASPEQIIPVEWLYFGGRKFGTVTPEKRYRLKWNSNLFSLEDFNENSIASGLYWHFTSVTVS
ncbi:hypothetical protein CALCODRAFT_135980 [Calocera cornea HHB12733]|uniref:Uncharacterized protein n=1 Tax=Calocera cornea HHB12733 TaxID=1353952 RepID=A0A165CUJ9_9BASI|nr:hypothetical protein CALCODRAFT_135980 [Calocera cornea HHB12733]